MGLLASHGEKLERFRDRAIESFEEADEPAVTDLFNSFDRILGPVGAAKALHPLAPRFFPLWDDQIARAYGLGQSKQGQNDVRYFKLMRIVRQQVRHLGGERKVGRNPVKAIDEFNYCRFTKGWV